LLSAWGRTPGLVVTIAVAGIVGVAINRWADPWDGCNNIHRRARRRRPPLARPYEPTWPPSPTATPSAWSGTRPKRSASQPGLRTPGPRRPGGAGPSTSLTGVVLSADAAGRRWRTAVEVELSCKPKPASPPSPPLLAT
jgi:hypothetical protein